MLSKLQGVKIPDTKQMHEISQYRNTEAHKLNAQKSQLSSDTMEIMTTEMHNLAIRTTQETVSMKIITLVTLFFLPGTFVSVSLHFYKNSDNSSNRFSRHL